MSVNSSHFTDKEGNPCGGNTFGPGFAIGWQNGPLVQDGKGRTRLVSQQNGAFVEDIIQAALDRLEYYQTTKFSCSENLHAALDLKSALLTLESRRKKREERGVGGTHEV